MVQKINFGMDSGGTKTLIGAVDRTTGKVIAKPVSLDTRQFRTNEAITRAIHEKLPGPEHCRVFIGAAGLIEGLQIKNAPNFAINEPVTFAEDLKRMSYDVTIINDMGAATSGVAVWGPGKGRKVSASGTFSSGSNYGIFIEGILRSMEASHNQAPAVNGWPKELPTFAQVWQYCFRKNIDYSSSPVVIQGMEAYNLKYPAEKLERNGLKPLTRDDLATPDGLARALYALDSYPEQIVLNSPNSSVTLSAKELAKDTRLFCGCSDSKGHLEPLVSANGTAWMAQRYFLQNRALGAGHRIIRKALAEYNAETGGNITPSDLADGSVYPAVVRRISAKHVYQAYLEAPLEAPQAFIQDTQVHAMAHSFGLLIGMHMPEVLVCMGGMIYDWTSIFVPAIALVNPNSKQYMPGYYYMHGIKLPEIQENKQEYLGLVGAVAYGILQERQR